jgi:hypothetical protein
VIEDESDVDDDDETLEENIYKDIRIEGSATHKVHHGTLWLTSYFQSSSLPSLPPPNFLHIPPCPYLTEKKAFQS